MNEKKYNVWMPNLIFDFNTNKICKNIYFDINFQ